MPATSPRACSAISPAVTVEAGEARLDGFDLVVNATPLGMEPTDPLPVDVGQITPNMLIGEIVMKREITPLVDAARSRWLSRRARP